MSSLKHIKNLKQIITEDDQETAIAIAAYSKEHDSWHMDLNSETVAIAADVVSEVVPLSKSYDEVVALAAIFLTKHKTLTDVPPGVLAYVGVSIDIDDNTKLSVKDSNLFWKHFNTILSNDIYQVRSDLIVKYLYPKPSLIYPSKSTIQIFTDPGTDSNLDDEKCCVYIEVMRNYLELWSHTKYVITAKGGLLDRKMRLFDLISKISKLETFSIHIYGDLNEIKNGKSTRFYAPYSAKKKYVESKQIRSLSFVAKGDHLDETDTILWIGQVGPNLSNHLVSRCQTNKIRCCVIQGPGFNTMGSDFESLRTIGESFAYVDTNGAAKVNHEQSQKQLQLIDSIHPDASSYRNNAIWGFMNTDEKFCFQRQFQGFKFSRDYLKVLEEIEAHIVDELLRSSEDHDAEEAASVPLPTTKFVEISSLKKTKDTSS